MQKALSSSLRFLGLFFDKESGLFTKKMVSHQSLLEMGSWGQSWVTPFHLIKGSGAATTLP